MTTESAFISLMRAIAVNPAARGLQDDAAVLEIGSEALVLTHDMMVEGIHWLRAADPADVAWKLVAVNLSDLAAKGARPVAVLLGFMLGNDDWDRRFAEGLQQVLATYDVPLLGGDTVGGKGAGRSLGLTAMGAATHRPVPSRSGAMPGDALYVTGTLGDAAAGHDLTLAGTGGAAALCDAFNRPKPLLTEGQKLAPHVHAMMDVSDGLLLDANRMAQASGLAIAIDLSAIPLSQAYIAQCGDTRESRLRATSWGDDYQLLFAGPADASWPVPATAVGRFSAGQGLSLNDAGQPIELPVTLGHEHR
ncbi:MAG: thiamine-phosphate kinase [Sphingorhabdus sp.]